MKAYLKNYRQSPRKVRLVADFIRGKDVNTALAELPYLDKRAAVQMKKILESAVANAKENSAISRENLVIKDISVDKGITLKRFLPRAFGRATPLNKRSSNIAITLAEKVEIEETEAKEQKPKVVAEKTDTAKKEVEKVESTEK